MANTKSPLSFFVNGKEFKWQQQYITGELVKDLAGIDHREDIFLSVEDPWKDQLINNNDNVDIAREDIEQFFTKRPLPYSIDGVDFESDRQYISGRQVRKQGNIPSHMGIFLLVKKPWEDEPVSDDDLIDLALAGKEKFISKSQDTLILVVNTDDKEWNKKTIEFREVVMLAFGQYDESPNKVYTVVYKNGPIQNPQGSMVAGQTVRVKNKMIFNVTETTKS